MFMMVTLLLPDRGRIDDLPKCHRLRECRESRQAHHAYVWTLDTLTYLIGHGIVTIPAPIYSLIYQELSNGMLGYMPMFALTPGWNIFCSNSNCSSYFFLIFENNLLNFIEHFDNFRCEISGN